MLMISRNGCMWRTVIGICERYMLRNSACGFHVTVIGRIPCSRVQGIMNGNCYITILL